MALFAQTVPPVLWGRLWHGEGFGKRIGKELREARCRPRKWIDTRWSSGTNTGWAACSNGPLATLSVSNPVGWQTAYNSQA